MQISSSAKHKQGSISTLSTIYQRHLTIADHYENLLLAPVADSAVKELVESLAFYHKEQAENTHILLVDLPQTPVKPNTAMQTGSGFGDVDLANALASFERFYQEERQLASTYANLLGNNDLPKPIYEQLNTQHRRVQEVATKLERLKKTGKDRDMTV